MSPFHTTACMVLEARQADAHLPRPAPTRVVWRDRGVITARRAGSVRLELRDCGSHQPQAIDISAPVLTGKKPEHGGQRFCV